MKRSREASGEALRLQRGATARDAAALAARPDPAERAAPTPRPDSPPPEVPPISPEPERRGQALRTRACRVWPD